MSEQHRPVIYAVDKEILPGPYPDHGRPEGGIGPTLEWYDSQYAVQLFTKKEATNILRHPIVLHHTYSLQQSDFARMGFEVTKDPWRVRLPEGALLVCIGTRDRYDIFDMGRDLEIHQFENVDEWRAGRSAEAEGWE